MMKKYKLSKYNVLFDNDGKHYIWNTFSDALIRLDTKGYSYVQNYSGEDDCSDYFKILVENGCIIDTRIDELGKVLFDEKIIMLNNYPKRMSYTIAPGLSCNYKCNYCFENQRTSFSGMSKNTQNQLFDYLCSRMGENKNLEKISINWFGGEPLLYIKTINYLSQKLINFCSNHNIQYNSGIMTNGRFLTKENVEILKKCRIGHVQLSVDGTENYYIKQKNATKEDFNQTIDNIVYASEYLPISVRINVSETIDEAIRLTDFLLKEKGLDGKIKIYIAQIREYDKNLSWREEQGSHGRFLDNAFAYMNLFGKNGKYLSKSFGYRVPKRKGASCLSSCNTNSCIGPKGEIYQCEQHFGIASSEIGSIHNGFFYGENKNKYIQFSHYKKCLQCKVFPVCLGGCIDDMVNGRNMINCKKYSNRLIQLRMFDINNN